MTKPTKADKITSKRIEQAYYASCSGVSLPIMDIPKVWAFAQSKIAEGEDDAALAVSIRAYVDSLIAR